MVLPMHLSFPSDRCTPWPVMFAEPADQDLEFDESFDETDISNAGHKPPYRRPIVYILLVVLFTIGAYFLKPELFSSIRTMIVSPAPSTTHEQPIAPHPETHESSPTETIVPPQFHEGQVVSLRVSGNAADTTMRLSDNASRNEPGPSVRAGDVLMVLDGTLVNNMWFYQVQTKSGTSGWIAGEHLKSQSS